MMRIRLTDLWRHTDFMKLWVGGTVSSIGSQITFLAAAVSAPALMFGLGTGVWVGRMKRRPVMIVADYGRAILICAVPVAALFSVA